MKHPRLAVALTLAGVALSLPAAAQFAKPEDAIKYRKGAFTVMGAHFSRIGAMAAGRVPFDAKVAAENADLVATLSTLPYAGFVPGTEKGDTRALPEIWLEREKFDAAAKKMQGEVVKLQAAARTGNFDQVKAAFGSAAQACKSCHEEYRKD